MKKFIPQSPDPFLRKDADMSLAKFGHINEMITNFNSENASILELMANSTVLFDESITVTYDAGAPFTDKKLFEFNISSLVGFGITQFKVETVLNGVEVESMFYIYLRKTPAVTLIYGQSGLFTVRYNSSTHIVSIYVDMSGITTDIKVKYNQAVLTALSGTLNPSYNTYVDIALATNNNMRLIQNTIDYTTGVEQVSYYDPTPDFYYSSTIRNLSYSGASLSTSTTDGLATSVQIAETNLVLTASDGGSNTVMIQLDTNGKVTFVGLPVYADNASALLGGLVANNMYQTATGEVRIVV